MASRKKSKRKPAGRRKSAPKKGRKKSAKKAGKKKSAKKSAKRKAAPKRSSKKKAAGKRKSAPKKKSAKKAASPKAVSAPPPSTPAAGGGAAAEVRPFRTPPAPAQPSPGMGSGSSGMGGAKPPGTGTAAGVPSPLAPGDVSDSEPHRIGVVTHYYEHAGACAVSLDAGGLRVGDTIHVRGHTTDFYQRVDRLERDHVAVDSARTGEEVGVQVSQRVRSHDAVYRLGKS
jgi:hypothetical protein